MAKPRTITSFFSSAAAMKRQGVPHVVNPIDRGGGQSVSTEYTITVETPDGKYAVIPTIVDGQRVSPQQATTMFFQGANPAFGIFDSLKESEPWARQRHLHQGPHDAMKAAMQPGGLFGPPTDLPLKKRR